MLRRARRSRKSEKLSKRAEEAYHKNIFMMRGNLRQEVMGS